MPTLSLGDTLSLNNLGLATDTATKSISSIVGGTPSAGDSISFSSFAIDSVGSIGGYTYGVEETSETYTLSFTGAGTRHAATIASTSTNFTWSTTSGDITIATGGDKSATITFGQNGDNTLQSVLQAIGTAHTLTVNYDEPYNDHIGGVGAGNMGQDVSKSIYIVDSYDGNAAALCLTADSPILLADGTIVDAGDLEEGDVLKGYSLSGLDADSDGTFLDWSNSELGEVSKDVTVVNLTFSFASRYYNVNDGEITGTSEHPMLVKDSTDGLFRFKELHNLIVGDKLIKSDSGTITEVNVDSITTSDSTVEIVSIDVEEQDTYLVNGYITHNKGGNSFTQFAGPAAAEPTYDNPAGAQNSTLNWTHPTATGTEGVTETQLQVDDNSDFSSLDATHSGTYSTLSVNVSGLSTGTWYARIRNREMGVWGSYSTALEFSHTFEN
jgi:hypothetical protein